jgi:hypothetical protein
MSRYYEILGVSAHANAEQIKAAYRALAKRYHPDISKEPNAHEKFVLITEAYEMLINPKEGPTIQTPPTEEEKRRQARAKAAAAARMKYEAFTKSNYYRNTVALSMLIDLFGFAFVGYLLIWFNVAAILYEMPILLLVTLPLLIVALYGTFIYMKKKEILLSDYIDAARIVFSIPITQVLLVALCNIIIFLKIGLNTLVPLLLLMILYALTFLLGVLWIRITAHRHRVLKQSLFPTLVSVLLVVNMLFASESYNVSFAIDKQATGKSTLLELENQAMHAFPHTRFFYSIQQTANKRYVEYQFAHGCLGIMVVQKRMLY